jgi:hypothetical protein
MSQTAKVDFSLFLSAPSFVAMDFEFRIYCICAANYKSWQNWRTTATQLVPMANGDVSEYT